MNVIAATLPTSLNWYDYVVLAIVSIGLMMGRRLGILRSLLRMITWLVMSGLALALYPFVGEWLRGLLDVDLDFANLLAFMGITLFISLMSFWACDAIVLRYSRHEPSPWVDNFGGLLLGGVTAVVITVWLTVGFTLMRSQFWHEQVARDSYFGARVVQQFPRVAEMANKPQPEELWFMRPLHRRADPVHDIKGGK